MHLYRKVGTLGEKTWQHSRVEGSRRARRKPKHDAEATNRAWEVVGNGQYFIASRDVLKILRYDLFSARIDLKSYGNNSKASRNLIKLHDDFFKLSRDLVKSMG